MPDPKTAAKAALTKLKPQLTATKTQLKELAGLADEHAKLTNKIQAMAKSAKPPLPKGATIGDLRKSAGRLQEITRLNEISAKYEQTVGAAQDQLSPKGRQRAMLDDLVSMTTANIEQHTGGKSGEGSRRDSRMIVTALKGLKDGQKGMGLAETKAKALKRPPPKFTDRTPLNMLDSVSRDFTSERKLIDELRNTYDRCADDLEEHGDKLTDALSQTAA